MGDIDAAGLWKMSFANPSYGLFTESRWSGYSFDWVGVLAADQNYMSVSSIAESKREYLLVPLEML